MQTISIRRDTKAWTMQVWISFFSAVETVTVDPMFAWLQRSGLGAAPIAVR